MKTNSRISIWFVIGLQLAIFGVLITGISIYDVYVPPANPPVLNEYHAGVYWGALILLLGLFYSIQFRPGKSQD